MYRLEELKCREIAGRIGISESAVEKHISRAMFFLNKWSEGW
jgi:RNA polymerase sigma-70 factor (ECF subfamily)